MWLNEHVMRSGSNFCSCDAMNLFLWSSKSDIMNGEACAPWDARFHPMIFEHRQKVTSLHGSLRERWRLEICLANNCASSRIWWDTVAHQLIHTRFVQKKWREWIILCGGLGASWWWSLVDTQSSSSPPKCSCISALRTRQNILGLALTSSHSLNALMPNLVMPYTSTVFLKLLRCTHTLSSSK